MKFREHHVGQADKVELQMTPMIDIVFQLLVFFIFTLRINAQEGDFNVKMPLAASTAGIPDESLLPPLKLRLLADDQGALRADGIQLNDRVFADFNGLHGYVRSLISDDAGPSTAGEVEIEIDCDYQLRYATVVAAITAVSGYVDANENVVKLIDKIKFAPPETPPGR